MSVVHPFRTDKDDHCETPFKAYQDIAPILHLLAGLLGKSSDELVIYDPYFCAGSMKRHLSRLGFDHVINECRDFYADIRDATIPDYDVLITNPPYSTKPIDHIERLMTFCADQKKPYFILQPCYAYTKPYFDQALRKLGTGAFFLTPSVRYVYRTPQGLRNVPANRFSTSPFVCLWFCYLPKDLFDEVTLAWCSNLHRECPGCKLKVKSTSLPDKYKDSHDDTRRRLKKKQRDAIKRRKMYSLMERARSRSGRGRSAGKAGKKPSTKTDYKRKFNRNKAL
eukprot:m.30049 g.30049  ORF g.30049 m.30049 type:complete len:281 (+) comp9232_c0_seq2:158-1000(+)